MLNKIRLHCLCVGATNKSICSM